MARVRLGGAGVALVATGALLLGVIIGSADSTPTSVDEPTGTSLDAIADLISERAATPPDADALRRGAIDGMLSRLGDPWAELQPANDSSGAVAGVAPGELYVTAEFLPGGIRYISVSSFAEGVAEQVSNALSGNKAGIILDLRGNSGGLLGEAVTVSSLFLNGGRVVSFASRGAIVKTYDAALGGDISTPLVVLVDTLTASSAEVVAAALKQRGRAVLIGQRTFGKGSVQEPFLLEDGSRLKLTIGQFRTADGQLLDGTGIEPDIEVNAEDARAKGLDVLAGLIAAR
jgi:C-terminal processing protease CtpA/Prc